MEAKQRQIIAPRARTNICFAWVLKLLDLNVDAVINIRRSLLEEAIFHRTNKQTNKQDIYHLHRTLVFWGTTSCSNLATIIIVLVLITSV